MKKRRQEAILEIIEKYDLSTQDELLQKLKDSGFEATQATVSRDIKELRLVKTMGANGACSRNTPSQRPSRTNYSSKFRSISAQSVVSADLMRAIQLLSAAIPAWLRRRAQRLIPCIGRGLSAPSRAMIPYLPFAEAKAMLRR